MAINPLQLPQYYAPQPFDFQTPLAQLGQQLKAQQQQQKLSDLGRALATEGVDYRQLAGKAADLGSLDGAMKFVGMAETKQKELEDRQTLGDLGRSLGGLFGAQSPQAAPAAPAQQPTGQLPRGIRNNNPLNIEAGNFTQGLPGYAGSDGRFARFQSPEQGVMAADRLLQTYGTKHGLNTVAGIVGRWAPAGDGNNVSAYANAVAQGMGVDPNQPLDMSSPEVRSKLIQFMGQHENGRPIQMASAAGSGGVMSDAPPIGATAAAPPIAGAPAAAGPPPVQPQGAPPLSQKMQQALPVFMQGAMNPRLPQPAREMLKALTEHALKQGDLTNDQKEYGQALLQGETDSFTTWIRKNKAAAKTEVNLNQQGESSFEKELGKKQADRWSKIIDGGEAAEKKLVDINQMREISNRAGSQGALVTAKEVVGPLAEAMGIDIKGLSDIQAYESIVQRLAPQQRAPGSGSTSDVEFKGFVKSMPGLIQNPAAREITLNTMEALARHEMAQAEIGSKLAAGEMKRHEAEKALRALPDPMTGFKEWRKANGQIYGQALKGVAGGGEAAAAPQAQQTTAPPPMEGARLAPDGKYYIQQNGKTYRVDP
jgi:hypothetical protein